LNNFFKYKKVFKDVFDVDDEILVDSFSYESVPQWDSIGHMSLIATLENEFNIMIEMDDVIDFGSFGKGQDILRKYNVDFEAGDYSIQLAFKRVSIKTLLSEYTTSDSWVTVFDIEVTKDTELNNYLNDK
jgi:acyl carrier protein